MVRFVSIAEIAVVFVLIIFAVSLDAGCGIYDRFCSLKGEKLLPPEKSIPTFNFFVVPSQTMSLKLL